MHMKWVGRRDGFTIIELVIVVVVIGILSAITIVSYNAVQQNARDKAAQTYADQVSRKIQSYASDNAGNFPASLADIETTDGSGVTYRYFFDNYTKPRTYCVTVTSVNRSYHISREDSSAVQGDCPVPAAGTPVLANDNCFAISASTITAYYNFENNNPANPACPQSVIIPDVIQGSGVVNIGASSFANRALRAVVINISARQVLDNAFKGNNLTSITGGGSLIQIRAGAFSDNLLTTTVVPVNIESIGASAYANNKLTTIRIPQMVSTVGVGAFSGNNSIACEFRTGKTYTNTGCNTVTYY